MRRGQAVARGAERDDKVGSRLRAEDGKPRRAVGRATGGGEERRVGRARDVDQRGAGVDNARGARRERRRAVLEAGDGDTPVFGGGAAGKLREVGERAGILGRVGAAEGQLAVRVIGVAAGLGLEGDTEDLGRDGALALEVVHESRDGVGVGDGTRSKIDRAETNDTIYAGEARGAGGSADRLGRDGEAAEADRVCVLGSGERAAAVGDGD